MAQINIQIHNLNEIRAAFRKSPDVMRKNLNRAIQRSILFVQKQTLPVTPIDTGALRNSLIRGIKFGNLRGSIGTNLNYAGFVHEGTRFMKGRPYLKTGVEKSSKFIDEEFKNAVQDTLDRIK
jgi:hypothetical protein